MRQGEFTHVWPTTSIFSPYLYVHVLYAIDLHALSNALDAGGWGQVEDLTILRGNQE